MQSLFTFFFFVFLVNAVFLYLNLLFESVFLPLRLSLLLYSRLLVDETLLCVFVSGKDTAALCFFISFFAETLG